MERRLDKASLEYNDRSLQEQSELLEENQRRLRLVLDEKEAMLKQMEQMQRQLAEGMEEAAAAAKEEAHQEHQVQIEKMRKEFDKAKNENLLEQCKLLATLQKIERDRVKAEATQ